MKRKLIVLLLLAVVYLSAQGQLVRPFTKGTLNMGGNISFQSDKLKDIHPSVDYIQRIKSLDLSLSSGYFLIDKLSAGIKVNYVITDTEYKEYLNPQDYIVQNLLIGPEIKYFLQTGIFCEASALYGFSSSGSTGKDHRQKWINYSYSAGIGYSLLLNRFVAIEPVIEYRFLGKKANEIVENDIITNGMIFSCGFQVYLDLKRNKQNLIK